MEKMKVRRSAKGTKGKRHKQECDLVEEDHVSDGEATGAGG